MNRLKELRISVGKSQAMLAVDLHIAQNTVSQWENESRDIDSDKLNVLADYFNVTTDYLLCRTNNPNPSKLLTPNEKTPTPEGEREFSDNDLMFALWGDSENIDADDLDDVKRYAAFVKERKKKNEK